MPPDLSAVIPQQDSTEHHTRCPICGHMVDELDLDGVLQHLDLDHRGADRALGQGPSVVLEIHVMPLPHASQAHNTQTAASRFHWWITEGGQAPHRFSPRCGAARALTARRGSPLTLATRQP